jgi:hypothetical protein
MPPPGRSLSDNRDMFSTPRTLRLRPLVLHKATVRISGYSPLGRRRADVRRLIGESAPISPPGGRDQLLDVVDVPPPLGRRGTSRLWQALLAVWNFGFERRFAGNTGPLPEKFGFGRL